MAGDGNSFIGAIFGPKSYYNTNIQGAGAHVAEAPPKKKFDDIHGAGYIGNILSGNVDTRMS